MQRKKGSPELEKLSIVLPHLIHHNNDHARDMKKWMAIAKSAGVSGSAAALKRAGSHMEKAGKDLGTALRKLHPK